MTPLEATHPMPNELACRDCGLPYADPLWADFVVSDEAWARLAPEVPGIVLCVTCMTRRAVRLGIEAPGRFTSGPFALDLPGLEAGTMVAAGWQPIETAPKDGSRVLLFYPNSVMSDPWADIVPGCWSVWKKKNYQDWEPDDAPHSMHAPTHWQPLPAPPLAASKEQPR